MLQDFVRVCYIPGTMGETFTLPGPLTKVSKPHPDPEKTTGVVRLLQRVTRPPLTVPPFFPSLAHILSS